MRTLGAIERDLDAVDLGSPAPEAARLLGLAEETLEAWVLARGAEPTHEAREGFRLLALHRQGAEGVPSFNACRETCREIAFHYNLLTSEPPADPRRTLAMMAMLVRHLAFFVGGKMSVEGLGDFCCASRPAREDRATIPE